MHASCAQVHASCAQVHASCAQVHASCAQVHASCVRTHGWHALGGFLLFGPGLIAVRRTDWTLWYSLAVIVAATVPGIWALYDDTPAGLFALPNGMSDFVYHLIGSGLFAITVVIHVLLANRRTVLTSS